MNSLISARCFSALGCVTPFCLLDCWPVEVINKNIEKEAKS